MKPIIFPIEEDLLQDLVDRYKAEEKNLPEPKKEKGRAFFVYMFFMPFLIIGLILTFIIKIPFKIIRYFRVLLLNWLTDKFESYHNGWGWDGPEMKLTKREQRIEDRTQEVIKEIDKLRDSYVADNSKLEDLYNLAVNMVSPHYGNWDKEALYIFEQFRLDYFVDAKTKQDSSAISYEVFCSNMCVLTAQLNLPNQCEKYSKILASSNNETVTMTSPYSYKSLTIEVLDSVWSSIINTWPRRPPFMKNPRY